MKSKRIDLISFLCLLILWVGGLIFSEGNYKVAEIELLITYSVVLYLVAKKNTLFGEITLFVFTFGLFLGSYPLMDLLGIIDIRQNQFFSSYRFEAREIGIAINAMILSLCAVLLTYSVCDDSSKALAKNYGRQNKGGIPNYFKIVFMVFFALNILYRGWQIVVYRISGSYLDLFTETAASNTLLGRLDFVTTIFKVLFYFALANLPTKRELKKYIFLYIIPAGLQLFTGRRAPVLVDLIFVFWFYCKYVHKIKLRKIVLPVLALMFLTEVVGNMRNNREVVFSWSFFKEFFVQQGISFDVIANTVRFGDELQRANTIGVPYFLGAVHKYLAYLFSSLLLQDSVFGHGQTMAALENSSYLGWKLTYLIAPHQYNLGRGTGSSFVAENYLFFGYFGVFVMSVLMIWFVLKIKKKAEKSGSVYMKTFFFILVQTLIYTPRNNFWIFISDVVVAVIILGLMNVVFPKLFKRKAQNRI